MTCPVTPPAYTGDMIGRAPAQVIEKEWIEFPGGELEGTRPKILCPACREKLKDPRILKARPLCFQCYRAELDCERALTAAGQGASGPREERESAPAAKSGDDRHSALTRGDWAPRAVEHDERWQWLLPLEPVDPTRLERLRADRVAARAALLSGTGRFVDKRRRAQIAARHALQQIAIGLEVKNAAGSFVASESERRQALTAAAHAAELQLPDAWLPFVMSR